MQGGSYDGRTDGRRLPMASGTRNVLSQEKLVGRERRFGKQKEES